MWYRQYGKSHCWDKAVVRSFWPRKLSGRPMPVMLLRSYQRERSINCSPLLQQYFALTSTLAHYHSALADLNRYDDFNFAHKHYFTCGHWWFLLNGFIRFFYWRLRSLLNTLIGTAKTISCWIAWIPVGCSKLWRLLVDSNQIKSYKHKNTVVCKDVIIMILYALSELQRRKLYHGRIGCIFFFIFSTFTNFGKLQKYPKCPNNNWEINKWYTWDFPIK